MLPSTGQLSNAGTNICLAVPVGASYSTVDSVHSGKSSTSEEEIIEAVPTLVLGSIS